MTSKLSIITICYNEPTLEKTCESVVNQTWQDFEWIVIDGGSSEETQKIWDKYKYRIDKFISEPDNGIYNACNKGIKLAEGEYVIFINAGDTFFTNDVLNVCKECFKEDDVLYGFAECNYNNKNMFAYFPKSLTKEWFAWHNICTQATFYKKSLFKNYQLYNENYCILSDYDKNLNLINSGIIFKCIPIVIASYDMSGISTRKKATIEYQMESEKIKLNYFSEELLDKIYKQVFLSQHLKKSFLEKIFSIKNSYLKKYKIITILGHEFIIKNTRRYK